jgi:transposase
MTESVYSVYVGIDWATTAHQVTVLDPARRLLAERSVPHTGEALAELATWLTTLVEGEPGRIAVAIEVPRGAVVDTLLERGCAVFALNPKQLDRFRDRHTVAGAKDDRRDAFVLADALRTDQPAFRPLQPEDPLVIQVRDLSRLDEDLLQDLTRLGNRLREQLLRFFPQPLALCPAADEPWLWALLELAPSPAAARRRTRARLEKLLRACRIRRFTADALRAELQTPALHVAPGTTEAASAHITLLVPHLRLLHTQRKACAARLEDLLARSAPTTAGRPAQRPISPSSAPHPASGGASRPPCSPRAAGPSPTATCRVCAPTPASPRSPSRAVSAASSACALGATGVSATPSITGAGSPSRSSHGRAPTTRPSGAAAIPTAARCAGSSTVFSPCSWLCFAPAPAMTRPDAKC